jgi:hypothetical protein
VISSAEPSDMPSVPSVTMNDGILALLTRNPLSTPQAPPASSAIARPMRITPQLSPPTPFIAFAATTPEKTSTPPTERSMPAVMIT